MLGELVEQRDGDFVLVRVLHAVAEGDGEHPADRRAHVVVALGEVAGEDDLLDDGPGVRNFDRASRDRRC